MQQDLFLQSSVDEPVLADSPNEQARLIAISEEALLLKSALTPVASRVLAQIETVAVSNPFRQRYTPGGHQMSVAMTCCGEVGWVTDQHGYRYSAVEPESGRRWLPIPSEWLQWVQQLAARAGFEGFTPDSCLINRYAPGAGMGLHQDRDERDLSAPIVSFSLGTPAVFRWGGLTRQEPVTEFLLEHGDVLIWGGADRLRFHGVKKMKRYHHPQTEGYRYNLTFRQS